jgi:hypothetical protein
MAWGVPKIGALTTVASGNVALAEPAGIAQGDVMVACIAARGNAAFTVPSGDWTVVASAQNSGNTSTTTSTAIASGVMAYCVRGGSAPALTFTRTAGDLALGRIIAYSGGHSAPYDTGSANTLGANSATVTTGTFNTAGAGELIVAMCAGADNVSFSAFDAATDPTTASGATDTTTAPTNGTWIERADGGSNTGADGSLAIADAIRQTAGATGTIQATASASSRHVMIAGAFKLPPNAYTLTCDPGAYTIAGTAAGLLQGYLVTGDPGAYVIAGTAATLSKGYTLTAASGSYTISGTPAGLLKTSILVGAPGSYSVSGTAAGLFFGRYLAAASGSYSVAGTDATLTYTPASGGYTLTCDPGAFSVSGTSAGLFQGYKVLCDPGSVTISGTAASLLSARRLDAGVGSYALTGTAASLLCGRLLTAGVGSFVLSGTDGSFRVTRYLTAGSGSFGISGTAVTFDYSGLVGTVAVAEAQVTMVTLSDALASSVSTGVAPVTQINGT